MVVLFSLTGFSITSAQGTVVVPNDAQTLSGQEAEFSLGTLVGTGSAVANLTGVSMTGSVGSLSPADVMGLTGISALQLL